MDAVKIFSSPKFGQVRIIKDDASEELLFCANDVTDALDYTNGRKAVADHVEKDDVTKRDITDNLGRAQSATFITESGVYSLIFSSKQERAREFKYWVTHEVLPSIRKTGKYEMVKTEPLPDKVQANLMFADWAIRTLNLNEASRIAWAQKISEKYGMVAEIPAAVNVGTLKSILHAATDLLKQYNVGISAKAFNRMLEIKGVVKQATRPGRMGKEHKWYVILPAFDKYGQNQQDPKYQQQTQIRWYDNTFVELLTIVGLNNQLALNMN